MNTLLKPPRTSTKYTLCAWRHWLIPKCLVRLACRPSTRRCTLCHWPLCRYLGREAFRRCFFRQCNPCGYGLGSCWFFANWYRFGCRSLRLSLRVRMRSRSIKPRTIASSISFVINDRYTLTSLTARLHYHITGPLASKSAPPHNTQPC